MEIYVASNNECIDEIVDIHMETFTGFFLTFLGKGFLKQLYKGFIEHNKSGLIIAVEGFRFLCIFARFKRLL